MIVTCSHRSPLAALASALVLALLCCQARPAAADHSATPAAPPLAEYRVRAGDTLSSVARRLYGSARRVDLILRHNDLGTPPYRLREGQVLRVLPDAWLASTHGGVDQLAPRDEKGPPRGAAFPAATAARAGAALPRASRIATQPRSGAVVEFSDATAAQLGEASLLLIAGADEGQVPEVTRAGDTTLLSGALRLRRPGGGRTVVATPSARVSFAEGEGILRVGADRATQVSVLRGGDWQVSGAGGTVTLRPGQGTRVGLRRPPLPPRPLPAAPRWTAPPPPLSLVLGGVAEVRGAYEIASAGDGAPVSLWHVQVARDERFEELLVDALQPSRETQLLAPPLPPGSYHLRVAALDDAQLEGPALAQRVEVAEVRLLPAGAGQGARLAVPPGLFCSLDGGEAAAVYAPLPLGPARAHSLRCSLTPGGPAAVLTIDGRMAQLLHEATLSPARWDGARGRRQVTLRIADGGGLPLSGARLTARPEGETLAGAVRERVPGTYELNVEWPRGAALGALHVSVNDLVELTVDLGSPAAPARPLQAEEPGAAPAARAGAFELALGAGLLFTDATQGPGRGLVIDGGRRFPLPFGALRLGLRAAVDDFSFADRVRTPCRSDAGDPPMLCYQSSGGEVSYLVARTTLSLALPVVYRLRAPHRSVVPYLAVAPQLVLDWRQGQVIGLANRVTFDARAAVHAYGGVLLRPFRARFAALLAEVGYRHVEQPVRLRNDASLSGLTLVLGLHLER